MIWEMIEKDQKPIRIRDYSTEPKAVALCPQYRYRNADAMLLYDQGGRLLAKYLFNKNA